jgi:hypothetical protein
MEEFYKFIVDYFKNFHHKLKDRIQNLYKNFITSKTSYIEILYQLIMTRDAQRIVGDYDTGRIHKEWSYHN